MNKPVRRLEELATIIPGFSPTKAERKKAGDYLLVGGRNIKNGTLVMTNVDSYVDSIDRPSFKRAIAQPGDIIVSTLFDRRKVYLYRKEDPVAAVNNSCAIIRSASQGDYVISYLRTLSGQQDFIEKANQATTGTIISRLTIKDLSRIKIPILPVQEIACLADSQIEDSSTDRLTNLKQILESKEDEIQYLKNQHAEMERFYKDRIRVIEEQIATNDLASKISHGETASIEFKSTLRWHIHKNNFDREIENEVLGAVVAFCNTKGGEIYVGIADDGTIIGLENDRFPNTDQFQLHFRNLLASRIIPSVLHFVDYDIVKVKGVPIFRIKCSSSTKGVWLKPDKQSEEQFFIRSGPSSTRLMPRQVVDYINDHFPKN